MAIFVAVLTTDGRGADPGLEDGLGRSVAFLGPPRSNASPDRKLKVAFAGRDADFASIDDVSVVASGRIDDRAALARALGAPAASAAALVLAAYAKWGAGLLERVIGDFAFVLWDQRARRLLAATDQFGARPIFYGQAPGALVVSSAIGPVRDSRLVDTALDETYIADFLALGVSLDQTASVHRGVRRLPPAHRLAWTDGALGVSPYWRMPPRQAPLRVRARTDYAEAFRETFRAAVADRLPAEGPITLQLSGGMDSSAVAAAACELIGADAGRRIEAHTIVYSGYPEEEGRYARLVVDRLGIQWRTWTIEDFLQRAAPTRLARIGPAPDALRELTAENAIVEASAAAGATHLDGLAADVLLSPRRQTVLTALAAGAWRPAAVTRHLRLFGALPPAGLRSTARLWLRPARPPPLPPWLDPGLVRRTQLAARVRAWTAARAQGLDALHGPFWSRLSGMGDPGNTGLDLPIARPFMDVRLVELAARLPAPMLAGKQVLREAMRGSLPREIIERPKTPLGQAQPYVRRQPQVIARHLELLDRTPAMAAYVDMDALRRTIEAAPAEWSRAVDRCEALAAWLNAHAFDDVTGGTYGGVGSGEGA